jgi:hypothetical protein
MSPNLLHLQTIQVSLTNIANAISAALADPRTTLGGAPGQHVILEEQGEWPSATIFAICLAAECTRLRALQEDDGQDGLASALETLRSPITRLMTEGW